MKTPAIPRAAALGMFAAFSAFAQVATASVLIPTDVSAWDRGGGAANGTNSGGVLKMTSDQTNMNLVDPDDPSTWQTTTRAWQQEFQGQDIRSASLTTNPWIIFDLGSVQTQLDEMFLWNVSESTGWQRGVKTFKLHYSVTPSTTIPVWASANNLTDGPTNVVNYSFTTGGWTQLGSTQSLDRGGETNIQGHDGVFDLSSIASVRYIGIEILSSWNDDGTDPFGPDTNDNGRRVGLNQVAFTVVPEPGTALLGGLGLLMLMRRRR